MSVLDLNIAASLSTHSRAIMVAAAGNAKNYSGHCRNTIQKKAKNASKAKGKRESHAHKKDIEIRVPTLFKSNRFVVELWCEDANDLQITFYKKTSNTDYKKVVINPEFM